MKGNLHTMNLNEVKLAGNLTRPVELKTAANGTVFATGTLAINNIRKENDTTYVDFTVFGKTAENLLKITGQGDNVMIDGRLSIRSYEAKDGSKRKSTEVIVNSFNLVSKAKAKTAAPAAADYAELPV